MADDEHVLIPMWPESRTAAHEYPFPCGELPHSDREALHPWLRQLVGLQPPEVRRLLEIRWKDTPPGCLAALANRLLEFEPKSLLTNKAGAWLLMERPLPSGYPPGHPRDLIVLPPPSEPSKIESGIAKFPFADLETLRLFATLFGAIYEVIPDHSGNFAIPEVWESLHDRVGDDPGRLAPDARENINNMLGAIFAAIGAPEFHASSQGFFQEGYGPDYREWSGSLILYTSGCGDMVLMRPSGRVAWMCHDDLTVSPIAEDFAGFLEYYVGYREQPFSLEMYGPPSPDTYS